MNNLESILRLLFKRVPAQAVIDGRLDYSEFDRQEFLRLAASYSQNYSEDEAGNILSYYIDTFRAQAHLDGRCASNTLGVFDALFYYAKECLTIQKNEVLCRYSKLLDWRQMAVEVSEDLIVSAYFARTESEDRMKNRGFSWKRVIGHNNEQLNLMVERGISENHFHLSGSAPIFHISWLSLMNNVLSSKMANSLKEYDYNRRYTNVMYSGDYKEHSFYHRYLQAALIRLLLYSKISGRRIEIFDNMVTPEELMEMLRLPEYVWEEQGETVTAHGFRSSMATTGENRNYTLREVVGLCCGEEKEAYRELLDSNLGYYVVPGECLEECLQPDCEPMTVKQLIERLLENVGRIKMKDIPPSTVDYCTYIELWEEKTRRSVIYLLKNPKEIENYLDELQTAIDALRFPSDEMRRHHEQELDYLLCEVDKSGRSEEEPYFMFSGERWLMYTMLRHIYAESSAYRRYYNLFYAYVLIKESIRSEIVQSNRNVGFQNFQEYQSRKMDLIEDAIYKDSSTRSALKESLITENIRTVELRIAPRNTASALGKFIEELDETIDPGKQCRYQFFYTLHFIKSKDSEDINRAIKLMECRHYKKRGDWRKQAEAIADVREQYPKTGERIRGIDAASSELGCRPEVFGSIFRYLKTHTSVQDTPRGRFILPQLRATYHVGEDFLDLADGLRAIDEAILFLNLDCGDRLGHALALGIDVEKWYVSKDNQIVLPQQDYLDNVVWIYNKLCQYQIKGFEILMAELKKEYDDYFGKIYRIHMGLPMINQILRRAGQESRMDGVARKMKLDFDLNDYYHAWQLRGDDPELYRMGYFDEREYHESGQNFRVNHMIEKELRYVPDVMLLYYYYHYNGGVREEGQKKIRINVKRDYIEAVRAIQYHMQREVSRKGIGIETNPSSNYMIGTFKRYEEHPILTFYNKGLTVDTERLLQCAQLPVSINTDDQGVFSTSLENEYALIACALEKVKDAQGHHVYNRSMIYEWLDNIRVMGNEQSFGVREYEAELRRRTNRS